MKKQMKNKLLKQPILILTLAASLALVFMQSATAKEWNGANDPSLFENNYIYQINRLPKNGTLTLDKMPWSESYFPTNKGSINFRWNTKSPTGFETRSPTRDQVLLMSRAELAALSPAEKYDLFLGRYDYPLKKEVARYYSDKKAKDWAGLCHGWASIALQYTEPSAVEVQNPDGITIPFGASDVKGLMSYYMAFHADYTVTQIGKRCFKASQIVGLEACKDVNPGALHVLLANEVGLRNQGFIGEVSRGNEVWNQPIYGYEVKSMELIKSTNKGSEFAVKAILYYADELDVSEWEPVGGTSKFQVGKKDLEYVLETDALGNITGGEWVGASKKDHPDFVWRVNEKVTFEGVFSGLNQLYQPARF